MREYSLDSNADNIFLINFSELKERFDPIYYTDVLTYLNKSSYEKFKLNALCYSFTSGFGAGGNDQTDEQNGIIQIRPTNLDNDGNLIFNRNIYVPNDNIGSKFIVENNDILFNNTNSQERVGKTAIAEDIGDNIYTFSNHITKFRVRENLVLPKYLFILLNLYQSRKIFYSICTNWNNQSGVGLDLLKKLIIPVPPKNKQQLVVDCYNKAYQAKQHKEQEAKSLLSSIDDYLLAELDIELPEIDNSLENRIFEVSFGQLESRQDPYFYIKEFQEIENNIEDSEWPIYHLKDIFEINRGGSPRPIHNYYTDDDDGLNWIRIGDTKSDSKYITQTSRKIKPSGARSSRKVVPGDFLLSNSMSFGRPYIMKIEGYIHDGWLLFRPKTELVNQDFLHSMLSSKLIYRLFSKATIGGVVENLNIDLVKNIKIPLPFLEKQNEIADHISNIRQAAQQLEQEANEIMENAKDEVERLILGQ